MMLVVKEIILQAHRSVESRWIMYVCNLQEVKSTKSDQIDWIGENDFYWGSDKEKSFSLR